MNILLKLNLVLLVLLSVATGVFKLTGQQADIDLFSKIGFSKEMTLVVGLTQLLGGLMLIYAKIRKIGAVLMSLTFVVATIAVFANGLIAFGFVSIIFIAMAVIVIIKSDQNEKKSKS